MVIVVGASIVALVALALLGMSFATERQREFTRPLGVFAAILAVALFVLYVIQ